MAWRFATPTNAADRLRAPLGMVYAALKKLGKHSLIYAAGPAVNKALSFVLLPLVTAYIGSTGNYGVVELAGVTIAIAGQVLGLNLLHGMQRFHGEYEDPRDRATLITTTLWLLAASTGLAFAVAWLARDAGAHLVFGSVEYAPALTMAAAILFFQTIGQVGMRYLQLLEKSVVYGVLTTVKMLSEIGLKVWFLVGLGLTWVGVLGSVLGGEMVVGTGLMVWIFARLGTRFSVPMAKRLFVYSSPLILSGLCMFVLHASDRFFVARLIDVDELGIYGLGYKLGAIANAVILEAFGLIWFPYVFGLKDKAEIAAVCRKMLTYFVLLMTWASLLLALFAREVVGVMVEPEFFAAHTFIPLVALGYVGWAVFQMASTSLYLEKRTGVLSAIVAGAAVFNLALNALLVPRLGAMGAAVTAAATFLGLGAATWIVSERVLPVGYEIGRVLAPLVLAVGLYFGACALSEGRSMGADLAIKLTAWALLPAVLVACGYLASEEKAKIRQIARSLRPRAGPGPE